MDFLLGDGILPQLLLVTLLIIVVFFILAAIEYVYTSIYAMSLYKTTLIENTVSSSGTPIEIIQDPASKKAITVYLSDNERTGIEFSYSFFLFVSPDTFTNNTSQYLHIFHKGYKKAYPLLGPGVFMKSDTNTMVIHMNSFSDWRKHVEIPNIPVDKWLHCAIVFRNSALEVYINGNLSKKMPFADGDLPYQNIGNVTVFSRQVTSITASIDALNVGSTKTPFNVNRQMQGKISRLNYFRYAIGFSEIQVLVNEGPSSSMETDDSFGRIPPYLQDSWWTTSY